MEVILLLIRIVSLFVSISVLQQVVKQFAIFQTLPAMVVLQLSRAFFIPSIISYVFIALCDLISQVFRFIGIIIMQHELIKPKPLRNIQVVALIACNCIIYFHNLIDSALLI